MINKNIWIAIRKTSKTGSVNDAFVLYNYKETLSSIKNIFTKENGWVPKRTNGHVELVHRSTGETIVRKCQSSSAVLNRWF